MSDEESFVILGTSPMASLELDGGVKNADAGDKVNSIQTVTPPGSCFTSLENSQIKQLENAREPPPSSTLLKSTGGDQSMTKSKVSVNGDLPVVAGTSAEAKIERSAESLLWSRPQIEETKNVKTSLWTRPQAQETENVQTSVTTRPQVEVKDDFIPLSLEDCAVSSLTLTQSPRTSLTSKSIYTTTLKNPSTLKQNANKVRALIAETENVETSLWTRPQAQETENVQTSVTTKPQVKVKDDFIPLSLEDCALSSLPLTQSSSTSLTSKSIHTTTLNNPSSLKQNYNKENLQPSLEASPNMANSQKSKETSSSSSSKHSSLAASFIMGEVNADVLKSSVYSQFPSISMQACAEDVVKLQNMVTEYVQLKTTLEKVNNTMKLFYENSLQWKDKMNYMETHYKQQLDECQKQILDLRTENTNLKKCIDEQVEQTKAVDVARQNDRDEMIQTISEKTALVENMRAQIVKLEQQQIATFEFLPKKSEDKGDNKFDELYITRGEHVLVVKDLKRQLSEMLASNLDLKDVEKQYIDELNCLKHNLSATEELIKHNRNEIAELQKLDADKQQKIEELKKSNQELLATNTKQNERILQLEQQNQNLLDSNAEQTERILLLEQQNQVHCKDFEMERESRQNAVGEKQQILQDLRVLQKRNQELIEEHQKFVDNYEKRVTTNNTSMGGSGFGSTTTPLVAAAAAAQTYINNPQMPIRNLPSSNPAMTTPSAAFGSCNQYNCPVCNKSFKSITVLTSHVNDCIDKH